MTELRRMMMCLVVCVAVGMAVFGCASSLSNRRGLTTHSLGEPSTLNPILAMDSASSVLNDWVFNGLLKVNEQLELEPDLAQSYHWSEDGKTITFILKKNIVWHDGAPFTAKDVVFTFHKILDPSTRTVRRSMVVVDGKPIQFKAINAYTVQAILPKPFAPFLTGMTMSILPHHLLEHVDIHTTTFNRHPIGTGPFKFVSWQTGQYLKIARFDHYFGQKAKLDTITVKIIPDSNNALIALQKKEIDACDIPPKDRERIQKLPHLSLFQYDGLEYTYLGFNLHHPFLSDKRVRQAIAHGINKDALVAHVLNHQGRVAHLPSSPVLWTYPPDAMIPVFAYDPSRSHALLKQAGFHQNKSGFYEKNGHVFELTLLTNKGNKTREKTTELIQQYLQKIGIKTSIQIMEWSALIKRLNEASPKSFDAVVLGWAIGIEPDAYAIWHSSQYPQGFNFIGYNNPAVDRLLVQGRETMDREARKSIYATLYATIARDVPAVFLYYPKTTVGIHKRVKGLSNPGPAGMMHRIESVFIAP